MSKPEKEIVKAIYVKTANDTLEFVSIHSKDEVKKELNQLKIVMPNDTFVVKTYCEIEEEPLDYFKFSVTCIGAGDIEISPLICDPLVDTFSIRHIVKESRFVIVLAATDTIEAMEKIYELYTLLYSKKYIKDGE